MVKCSIRFGKGGMMDEDFLEITEGAIYAWWR
jgi:hypothetical protein